MSGTGHGAFGDAPFGVFPFGEESLVHALPGYFRENDEGERLQRYQRGCARVLDRAHDAVNDLHAVRDPARTRVRADTARGLLLGAVVQGRGAVEARGGDGLVYATGEFVAPSGAFVPAHQGQYLSVAGATPGSARVVRIAAVVSRTTVLTDPTLTTDAGPLRWERFGPGETPPGHMLIEVMGDLGGVGTGWLLDDGYRDTTLADRREYPSFQGPFVERAGAGTINGDRLTLEVADLTPAWVGRLVFLTWTEGVGVLAVVGAVASTTEAHLLDARTWEPLVVSDRAVRWFLRPRPRVLVAGALVPRGVVTAEGTDAKVLTAGVTAQVFVASAPFTAADVGRWFTLYPGEYSATAFAHGRVVSVAGSSTAVVAFAHAVPLWSQSARWELRDAPNVSADHPRVHVAAPDLLTLVAGQYDLELDRFERDDRRRAWVESFHAWVDEKGTARAYALVGEITGQALAPQRLYRLGRNMIAKVPVEDRVEVRLPRAGAAGTAGSFAWDGTRAVFSDAAAALRPEDRGRLLRVLDAATVATVGYYTLAEILSPTSARLAPGERPAPEAGTLEWVVAEVFTPLAPMRFLYEEIAPDVMEAALDPAPPPDDFRPDAFAWEVPYSTSAAVVVTACVAVAPQHWRITATGAAWPAITRVGWWRLRDYAGAEHWIETLPTGGPSYQCEVRAREAPALGAAVLTLVPHEVPAPDYAPVPAVLADIDFPTDVVPGENRLGRLLRRVTREILPAHARLVPRNLVALEASFDFGAGVEVVGIELLAPITPYYDEVPGDAVPADLGLHAEIET